MQPDPGGASSPSTRAQRSAARGTGREPLGCGTVPSWSPNTTASSAGELERQGAALALPRAQHGDGGRVEVDDARLAGLGRPLPRTPLLPLTRTMPTDRRTLIVAASRSMSRQRSASSSPRRMPV